MLKAYSLLFGLLAIALHLILPILGYSCIYVICDDNSYCCGDEQCCFNFGSIWYAWVLGVLIFVICCICGCRYSRRHTGGAVVVSNPVVPQQQRTAIVVSTQQQISTNAGLQGQYGATHGHPHQQHQPYHHQHHPDQKYMDAPPAYQPGPYQPGPYQPGPYQPGPYQQGAYQQGAYQGAPTTYQNAPVYQGAPAYNQAPVSSASAPPPFS